MKHTTTGFPASAAIFKIWSSTSFAGGLDTSTMISVFGSSIRAFRHCFIMIPPISAFKSLPPVPSSWETPSPNWSIMVETSCAPVPEAHTRPIFPGLITFANARGTWLITAVPQSGPIIRSSFETAYSFSAFSSSMVTLSLNSITLMSRSRQSFATSAAKRPGTEITAMFRFFSTFMAPSRVGGKYSVLLFSAFLFSSSSTFSTTFLKQFSSSQSAATKKSFAVTSSKPSASKPRFPAISRFRSVPMPTSASETPDRFFTSFEMIIRVTES